MPSKKLIASGIVALIVVIVLVLFVVPVVTSSPAAVLKIEQGNVAVNEKPAVNGMTLKEGDIIATEQNAKASIVLFGASSVRLAENTVVEIAELSDGTFRLIQKSGSTWNKVTQLSGLENYQVETPHATAATAGTTFGCKIVITSRVEDSLIKSHTECSVLEGQIGMTSEEDGTPVFEGQTGSAGKDSSKVDKITITDVSVNDPWIQDNLAKDEKFIEDVKARIKSKYSAYIPIIKSQYGLSDSQIDEMLDNFLSGKYSSEQYASALAELKNKGIEIKIWRQAPPAK